MSKKGKSGSLITRRPSDRIVRATPSDLTNESIERLRNKAHEALGVPLLKDFALTEENFARYAKRLGAYQLITANIFYRCPDRLWYLQQFIWQDLDLAPGYPVLRRFLKFWQRELDGPLHSVQIGTADVFKAPSVRAGSEFRLN